MMDIEQIRAELRAFALTLPEAYEEHPWGETATKVNKKVFVFFNGMPSVTVKLPVSGQGVLSLPFTERTNYGLGNYGWVTVRFDLEDEPPLDLVQDWIIESYRAIAPKKLVAQLDNQLRQS